MLTSEKIKHVAFSLFAHYGYEGTSLEDIASEVGIKKPSIYAHFRGKDELFLSIFEEALEKENHFIKNVFGEIEELSVNDKLFFIVKHFCEDKKSDEILFLKRALFFPPKNLREKVNESIVVHENLFDELLIRIFNEGIDAGIIVQKDISIILAAYYCLIDGLVVEKQIYTDEDYRTKIDAVWTIFWSGITGHTVNIT